jgi:hypothetical protein
MADKCYQGDRGFVHVFRPGERTCECGKIKGKKGFLPRMDGRRLRKKKGTGSVREEGFDDFEEFGS